MFFKQDPDFSFSLLASKAFAETICVYSNVIYSLSLSLKYLSNTIYLFTLRELEDYLVMGPEWMPSQVM